MNWSTAPRQTVDWEALYRQAIDERDKAVKRCVRLVEGQGLQEWMRELDEANARCEQAIDALRALETAVTNECRDAWRMNEKNHTENLGAVPMSLNVRSALDVARAALLGLGEHP